MSTTMEYATAGERAHAKALVRALLKRGFTIQVKDEEETLLRNSADRNLILAELAHSGENYIRAFNGTDNHVGTFYLIWGNDPDGSELIADHSDNELCNEIYDEIAGNAY